MNILFLIMIQVINFQVQFMKWDTEILEQTLKTVKTNTVM